jgi:histidinol-phosphate aminotransferase
MTGFPREDYRAFQRYTLDRRPIEVDLSDNTNLWGAHPDAVAALKSAPDEALTRYPSLYADSLRAVVARRFDVSPDCVSTGCGSDDVLDSAIRAACRPPGLLTYAAPTFSMAEVLSRMNGLDTSRVAWPDALAEPARLLEGGPAAVYLCSPNNPTGAPLPGGWLGDLLDRAGRNGPLVIVDEAYAEFDGQTHASLVVERGRALVVRTLSKLYALAGVRVGYGVGRADVVDEVEKSRGPYKVSAVAERAAVAALEDESGWAQRVLGEVLDNRERLARELRSRGFAPLPSVTNFLLMSVTPRTTAAVTAALRERGVAVRPFPGLEGLGDAIRVTVGPWPMMERFLAALDEVVAP